MIAHVDMDAFYAQVEQTDDPALAGRPVVVGMGRRGVVSAASYEAREYGVRSAMPVFQAKKLCPAAVFLPVRMERYRQVSRMVMECFRGFTPLVEPVSVDEAFLDLAGTARLWGGPTECGLAIKERIRRETGLTCSVGMAPLRFLAKIASGRDKPDGLLVVRDTAAFIGTITLKEVSGAGARTREKLAGLGIKMLADVLPLGEKRLTGLLGSFGGVLWDLARGIDPRGVSPVREVKSVSHERTFSEDIADKELLAARLLQLCQMVGGRLRRAGLAGRTVTLKLRHKDHRLVTRSLTLPRPTNHGNTIYAAARELLFAYPGKGPFRLIGAQVSQLAPVDKGQGFLFNRDGEAKLAATDSALDTVRQKFGESALLPASVLTASPGRVKPKKEPGR